MREDDIYFAGLFDGEGCVLIDKQKPAKTGVNPVYRLTAVIAMCDREPLDRIMKIYGVGGIYNAHYGRLAQAPAFAWRAASRHAVKFLSSIYEHARVKREEIRVALEFQSRLETFRSKRFCGGSIPNTQEELAKREEYRVELQRLKRRFKTHQ